jgi:hypothetical protein
VQAIVGNGDGVLRPTGTHEIRDAAVTAVCAFLPLRRRVAESSTAALYALSWVGSASSSWQECGGEEWGGAMRSWCAWASAPWSLSTQLSS